MEFDSLCAGVQAPAAGDRVAGLQASLRPTDTAFSQKTEQEWSLTACAQACKHPLLVIGAGANRKMTSNMLRRFVELTKIPWVESQMGKGVIDARELSPLSPSS